MPNKTQHASCTEEREESHNPAGNEQAKNNIAGEGGTDEALATDENPRSRVNRLSLKLLGGREWLVLLSACVSPQEMPDSGPGEVAPLGVVTPCTSVSPQSSPV